MEEGASSFGACGDDDILAHGQALKELIDLVGFCQSELAHRGDVPTGDVATVEHDAARRRPHLTVQHLEERALAGAVGTDEGGHN